MSNQYVIQKETLDSIAAQSMSLAGKTDAVSTSEIITDLTSINTEVDTQANLIEQIQTALENKESGDIPSISNPVLQSKTVTPTASQIEVVADDGYDGLDKVVVEGDTDLVAGNIKSGVSIFGVIGEYTGAEATTEVIALNNTNCTISDGKIYINIENIDELLSLSFNASYYDDSVDYEVVAYTYDADSPRYSHFIYLDYNDNSNLGSTLLKSMALSTQYLSITIPSSIVSKMTNIGSETISGKIVITKT